MGYLYCGVFMGYLRIMDYLEFVMLNRADRNDRADYYCMIL